jgi:S1-C subfamily serine protease
MVCEALSRDCRGRLSLLAGLAALAVALASPCSAQDPATIARVKPSIVAVGTFERTRNPQFTFAGTGFAVADGSLIATNQHVLPKILDGERIETIAIAVRTPNDTVEVRRATKVASDPSADLALLKIEGAPLPALQLGNSGSVREGELYLFTGFPIGGVLGLFPVTHRAMVSSITPVVIPAARADQLDARSVRRLQAGAFKVFQLDGTAYPGNSGSPVYGPRTGEVIGVVNSVFVKGTKEAALTAPSGITYAIPAERLKALLQSAQ